MLTTVYRSRLSTWGGSFSAAEPTSEPVKTRSQSVCSSAPVHNGHNRASSKLKTKRLLQKLFELAGLKGPAAKLRKCGYEFAVLRCKGNHSAQQRPLNGCNLRACPFCAEGRANKAFKRTYPRIRKYQRLHPFLRPCLLTLTLDGDSSLRNAPLIEQVCRIKEWLRNMRRTQEWQFHVSAGVFGIESMYNVKSQQWHTHIHVLIFRGAWWPKEQIARLWKEETNGHGGFIDIRILKKDGLRGAVIEAVKYPFKPANIEHWGPEQAAEFMALKGKRLAEQIGGLRSLKITVEEIAEWEQPKLRAGDFCPSCQGPLYWDTVKPEELIDFSMVRLGRGP